MRHYWKYFSKLLRHKYYVFVECCKQGKFIRGIFHDSSKFLPSEFIPMARYTYGDCKDEKEFEKACSLHRQRNKHHWQNWIYIFNEGHVKVYEIKEPYFTEMICDWVGAGKNQGKVSPMDDKYYQARKWYHENKDNMYIHYRTKKKIEKELDRKIMNNYLW